MTNNGNILVDYPRFVGGRKYCLEKPRGFSSADYVTEIPLIS
jgi:hypothetical protein